MTDEKETGWPLAERVKHQASGAGQTRAGDGLASKLGSRRARTGSLVEPASKPPTAHTSRLAGWISKENPLHCKDRLTVWHNGRHLQPCFSALVGCRSSALLLLAWPRSLIPAARLLLLARPPPGPCPFFVGHPGSTAAISPRLRAPCLPLPHTLADTPSTISLG